MEKKEEAEQAIKMLDNYKFDNRPPMNVGFGQKNFSLR